VSGVEDMIVDGVTGFLVDPNEGSAGFGAGLARLVEDTRLRERMGTAAALHARRWRSDTVLPEWETLLRAVAGETRRRRHDPV
jgi:glycosyltransferase involved in cell wall biosynthesis